MSFEQCKEDCPRYQACVLMVADGLAMRTSGNTEVQSSAEVVIDSATGLANFLIEGCHDGPLKLSNNSYLCQSTHKAAATDVYDTYRGQLPEVQKISQSYASQRADVAAQQAKVDLIISEAEARGEDPQGWNHPYRKNNFVPWAMSGVEYWCDCGQFITFDQAHEH